MSITENRVEQTVILSVAEIPLRVGKGYNGFTQGGAFPAIARKHRENIKKQYAYSILLHLLLTRR